MIDPSMKIERRIVPVDMVILPLNPTNSICCCVIFLGSIPISKNVDRYNKLENSHCPPKFYALYSVQS